MKRSETAAAAFVGTGIMGGAIARNLLHAGVPVVAHNRTASKAAALVADGATTAESPAAAVEALPLDAAPRVLFVNVPDTPDVEAVLFGERGVLTAPAERLRDLTVVDHSTICPVATKRFAERLGERGVAMLDAPVSGGDVGARDGTLTIMCGGDPSVYDRVLPLLEIVGGAVTRLGPAGSGQVCKACNQIAGMTSLAGVCEALGLAKRSGLALGKVIEVVSGGAAGSWQLANLGPKVAAGDHAPGFTIDLLLKDLRLVDGATDELRLPTPVIGLVRSLFQAAAAEGDGAAGTQALAKVYERLGGFRYDA